MMRGKLGVGEHGAAFQDHQDRQQQVSEWEPGKRASREVRAAQMLEHAHWSAGGERHAHVL